MDKGDTKKDVDQSMKASGADRLVKDQAAEIRKIKDKARKQRGR